MALITEQFTINGRAFTRTYSDDHRYVCRDGEQYEVAEDPTEFGRVYTEGDKIEYYDEEITDEELAEILLGGGQ